MSCILQHDDMILELNWSTTRTWRIITQLWFVCFIHKKDRNVFKSQRKQIYWKYKTYFPFARLLQSAYHVLHNTYTTYRNLGTWNHSSSRKRLREKAKLTLSDHSFQRHGDNLKRNRKTKMANGLVAWPNRRCTGYIGHVLGAIHWGSIQPKFPEISVQNSMDRFGPTRKVSKKRVHLLRWSSFPGRTGWNFGWMDRAHWDSYPSLSLSFSLSLDWRSGSLVSIPLSGKSRTVWCGLVHFHISVISFTGEITFEMATFEDRYFRRSVTL